MKKALILVSLFAMLFSTAAVPCASCLPDKRVRLTIINKSGMDIEVSLNGADFEQFYYLRVPEGDRTVPYEQTFTVVPDDYSVRAYFVELWDPVYGATCEDRQGTVDINHNTRLIIFECSTTPPNGGEPPIIKLGGRNGGGGRRR